MLHEPIIVLDFETTGLQPENGDRITEVGMVRIESGRVVDHYESLVNCGTRVPRHITAYTGITQQMVDAAPPVADVMRQMARFIGETSVVSHSATFDQRFFIRECRRLRIGIVLEPFICSMRLARRIYPELRSHSLAELARALQLPGHGAAHRAAVDARVTAELMMRMGHDIADLYDNALVTARLLRRLMNTPVADIPARAEKLLCA